MKDNKIDKKTIFSCFWLSKVFIETKITKNFVVLTHKTVPVKMFLEKKKTLIFSAIQSYTSGPPLCLASQRNLDPAKETRDEGFILIHFHPSSSKQSSLNWSSGGGGALMENIARYQKAARVNLIPSPAVTKFKSSGSIQ